MCLISVVLPTYNGSKFLEQSVESIRSQTFKDWELIIVDDCSSDETPHIAKQFALLDGRIRYIRNETNMKLPASLNIGFAYARGAFHTWTSDDNYFESDAFEIMVDAIRGNPEIDLVYCDVKYIDENGGEVAVKSPKCLPSRIYLFNPVRACFLYRAQMYDDLGGYDESLFLVEDYDFWMRAYRSHRFLHIGRDPYCYRVHSGSLTSTRQKEIRSRVCLLLRRELGSDIGVLKKMSALIGLLYNQFRYAVARG